MDTIIKNTLSQRYLNHFQGKKDYNGKTVYIQARLITQI